MNAIQPTTLFDKIWASRVVMTRDDGQALLYVDRHILHEGSTPLAFGALRSAGRELLRPDAMIGMIDHTIPTRYRDRPADDPLARAMMASFHQDTREFGVPMFDEHDVRQGIVHIVGPEQGFTLPGTVMVCGDSHTSTNGAFGAFAFGIGTSEVEHVFATRTLWRKKPKNLLVQVDGELPRGVSAKDMILTIIGRLGIAGGTGHVIEYAGSAIRALSMQGRMTVCNMSIEAGARGGLIAPDETTFAYLKDRPLAPAGDDWERALESWRTLKSDPGASYDSVMHFDATAMLPMVTWGTTPQDIAPLDGHVPDPALEPDVLKRAALERALHYMGLQGGMRIADIAIDEVFIGSCTNGRIEDLRAAAEVLRGRSIATGVHAIVVPGSGLVKRQAEAEGLDEVFRAAGFEWRSPGCSLCLAMNDDRIAPGKRCASTSNRNFEGRQGREARTHLVSPAMAASAAVTGRLAYSAPLQGGNR